MGCADNLCAKPHVFWCIHKNVCYASCGREFIVVLSHAVRKIRHFRVFLPRLCVSQVYFSGFIRFYLMFGKVMVMILSILGSRLGPIVCKVLMFVCLFLHNDIFLWGKGGYKINMNKCQLSKKVNR